MTSKNNTTSTPDTSLVPDTTKGNSYPTKIYPPLDVSSTVSIPLAQYPTVILVAVRRNTSIHDTTNTPFDTTEALKTIISSITESLPFLVVPISYETKTVLLNMEYLNQELINASAT